MPNLGFFGLEFENTIIIIEISTIEFMLCKVWCKNENPSIWGQELI